MLFNSLYIMHALIIWAASSVEIVHIYKHKSAKDVKVWWIAGLLVAELIALPLALSSGFWAWWLCHVIGAILVSILLFGVIHYRK